jgi:hypothetical protein
MQKLPHTGDYLLILGDLYFGKGRAVPLSGKRIEFDEKNTACNIAAPGWELGFCASIHWRQNRCSATTASHPGEAAGSGTWVYLGRRVLVSRRKPLFVAQRILDSPAVCGGPMGGTALRWRTLLQRILGRRSRPDGS